MNKNIDRQIIVEANASYRYPVDPQYIIIDKKRYKAQKIISRMRSPEKETYTIELETGKKHKISYITEMDMDSFICRSSSFSWIL